MDKTKPGFHMGIADDVEPEGDRQPMQ